jgi:endonuclease I
MVLGYLECAILAHGFADADLHNLRAALGAINSSRGDKLFANEVQGKSLAPNRL